jgi:DNA polymerase-3 subunit delta'
MERILGHEQAIRIIVGARECGRMHHAWIFSGPRGVGKFTTAIALARLLLQEGAAPAERDRIGRLIDAGTHPDLHVILKELARYSPDSRIRERKLTNIPIDVLRERMIGGVSGGRYHEPAVFKTPVLGRAKVFIIDEAELLEEDAQDLMLKTLEEPPPRTYVFLITTRPHMLRPTVHSRCQNVRFGRLEERDMDRWLEACGLEPQGAERDWVKRFAAGSPGAAQLAITAGLFRWSTSLDPLLRRLEAGEFPLELGETMADLVDGYAKDRVKGDENASKELANKEGARHLFTVLADGLRRRLEERLEAGDDTAELVEAIELLASAERQIDANVNLKPVLENLAAQMWSRAAAAAG